VTPTSSFAEFSGRLLAFIERSQAAEEAQFNSLARELFGLQFSSVAPYRLLCASRQIAPETLTDWRQIPAVPTSAFKEFEFTSLAPAERAAVFHSSGTTGHRPSRHFHSSRSLTVYEASLLPWFKRHMLAGSDVRPVILSLAPPPEQAPHSSLVHMFAAVSRAFDSHDSRFAAAAGTDNSWTLDTSASLAALRHAEQSGRPILALGTAFMFMHLLDALEQQGLSIVLPPGSRVMETGGYKGRSRELPKPELHALITALLGIPASHLVCEYGMSELSSQAYDRVAGDAPGATARVFHFPHWCRALVICPETGREVSNGETGLLRIFDLANVRSVMAIQTEDLAVRSGDGFELLGRATLAESRGCSLMTA